ncbi:LPS export ABC transporter permease LptG [Amaricoccus tamworthensis]|uniref:LPS export ABC transporter permease LptG n=1 Tax=Amaricoccus tamworthensis TaxID=57002 RepID=UPI003C7A6470
MTLWRYLLKAFIKTVLMVFIVLSLVVMLFALVENLRRFGDEGVGAGAIFQATLIQVPETMYQVFPLVLLLGSMLMFLRFSRSSELVVMRASGVSALRLVGIPVLASIILGILFIVAVNPFVAATMRQSQELEDSFRGESSSMLSFSKDGLWLRQSDAEGQTVIQAARTNASGTILADLRMHRFNENGEIYARVESPFATLLNGTWEMRTAHVWELQPDGVFKLTQERGGYRLDTDLTQEQILDSFAPPEMINFWQLGMFIQQIEQSGFSGLRHRLYLQTELAKPALFAAMVLIGSAFALRPSRFGQTGVMMLFAILAGFSLYFLKDFAETLGAQGQVPLFVAAWTPQVAAILLATGLLLHLEDG